MDGSPTAEGAAREAAGLARNLDAVLHLVTATKKAGTQTVRAGGGSWTINEFDRASEKLRALAGALGDGLRVECSVLSDDPAKTT